MKALALDPTLFHRLVNKALIVALFLHSLLCVLFSIFNLPTLMFVQVACIAVCLLALLFCRISAFKTIGLCIWADLIGQTMIMSQYLGWQSGFHFYLWLLIPIAAFYGSFSSIKRIVFISAIIIIYLLMDDHFYSRSASLELTPHLIMLLRYFNMMLCLAIQAYFLHAYLSYIEESRRLTIDTPETDQLTGLHNREAMLSKIDELFASSFSRQHMSLIIADIDYFKIINEQYGHDVGDAVLVYVAQILHDSIRQHDRASRWGGGEFLLLLPSGSLQSAEQIAERVKNKLAQSPLKHRGRDVNISMTFGIAELLPSEDFNQCLIRADIALRDGKTRGRNCIQLAVADDMSPTTPNES
jgi:diguanylate cyclase (GGDEF)-like protein